jgi:hypothetical protein
VARQTALQPAIAAGALAEALRGGAPFSAELDALAALGVGEADIAALRPHATAGLPTHQALQSGFDAAIADVPLEQPVPANAGTVERLLESARGLVEVRRAGPTTGDQPAAVVTRVRAALAAGDLETALAEWRGLPENARTATAAWAERAEARLAAERLVAKLRGEALARLDTQG